MYRLKLLHGVGGKRAKLYAFKLFVIQEFKKSIRKISSCIEMHVPEKVYSSKGDKYKENKSRTTSVCFQCKFETVKPAVMEKSVLLIVSKSSFLGGGGGMEM